MTDIKELTRVNIPDPDNKGARIVGFRIREGDEAWGQFGLSEPLAWLERIAAAPSASMGRVTVKALEFSADGRTSGPLSYTIDRIGDRFYARSSEATGLFATIQSADTLDEAKAACQSDYEARILSALGGGEGWVMVPREPTMAMMAAGADRVDDSMAHANAVYRAMLASLPTQESEDGR